MLVRGTGNEVIGQVGAAVGHGGDIVDGEVQFLKTEPSRLANRPAEQLVAGDRQGMALRPGRAIELSFHTKEAVGVQAQDLGTHHVDGVQGVADDHLLRGEGRVQPVE